MTFFLYYMIRWMPYHYYYYFHYSHWSNVMMIISVTFVQVKFIKKIKFEYFPLCWICCCCLLLIYSQTHHFHLSLLSGWYFVNVTHTHTSSQWWKNNLPFVCSEPKHRNLFFGSSLHNLVIIMVVWVWFCYWHSMSYFSLFVTSKSTSLPIHCHT